MKIERAQVGVTNLVEEGAFSAAFPLHDVSSFMSTLEVKGPRM